MYDLIHPGVLSPKELGGKVEANGFESSRVDSCAFRMSRQGQVTVITVVYRDDLLLLRATKEDQKHAQEDLGLVSHGDLGDVSYYLAWHIPCKRNAEDDVWPTRYVQAVAARFDEKNTGIRPASSGMASLLKEADGPQTTDIHIS